MNLFDFRQKNPAYADTEKWSDADLADGLYRKYYSDMDRAEFDQAVMSPPVEPRAVETAPPESPGLVSRLKGALLPEMPSGRPTRMPPPEEMLRDPQTGVIPSMGPPGMDTPGMSTAPATELQAGAEQRDVLSKIPTQVPVSEALKSTMDTWQDRFRVPVASTQKWLYDHWLKAQPKGTQGSAKYEAIKKGRAQALQNYNDALQAVAENRPVFNRQPYTKLLTEVVEVTQDMLPAIGGGLVTGPLMGPQAVTLTLMGGQAFGPSYMEGIENGENMEQATFRGFAKAGIEAMTEKIPIARLFERGPDVMRRVLDMTVYEGSQEAVASILSDLYDKETITPDMTMQEALERAGYSFLIGAGAGGTLGTAAGLAHKAMTPSQKSEAAGALLDLVNNGQVDPKAAENIAVQQGLPWGEEAIEPTGHLQKERVGPQAGTRHRQVPAEQAQQDREDKAKIQKVLEEELGQAAVAEERGEIATPEKLTEAVTEAEEAAAVEREYTGKPIGAMEEAFERAVDQGLTVGTPDAQPAYHGSPHDFDVFSTDAIGTGEGAQAYGHGLYFAENPGVAKSYKSKLSSLDHIVLDPAKIVDEVSDLGFSPESLELARTTLEKLSNNVGQALFGLDGAASQRGSTIHKEAADVIRSFKPSYENVDTGSLYEVDIPDTTVEQMLDWDAPLSEQPESVQKALKENWPISETFESWADAGMTGGQFHNSAEHYLTDVDLSKKLNSIGIPGIKYFDQGSRAKGEGTRNLVMFDAAPITILKKNGAPFEGKVKATLDFTGMAEKKISPVLLKGTQQALKTPPTETEFSSDPYIADKIEERGSEYYAKLTPEQEQAIGQLIGILRKQGMPEGALSTARTFMAVKTENLGFHQLMDPGKGNHSLIAIKEPGAGTGKAALMQAMSLAHEVGHSVDAGARKRGEVNLPYASETSPLFGMAGSQMGPILQELDNAYQSDAAGLKRELAYPLSHIESVQDYQALVKSTGGVEDARQFIASESFAQLFALYYGYGKSPQLQEALPESFEFMENIDEILRSAKTIQDRDARIRKAFRTFKPRSAPVGTELRGAGKRSAQERPTRSPAGKVPSKQAAAGTTPDRVSRSIKEDLLTGDIKEMARPAANIRQVDIHVPGAADKVKRWFKRNLRKEGLLNEATFEQKINMEGQKNLYENELSQRTADLGRSIAKAYGKKLYSQIPADALEDVNDYLAGYEVDLPEGLAETLDGARAYLDRLSGGMLRAMKDMLTIEYERLSDAQREKLDASLAGTGPEYVPPSMQKHWNLYQTISSNMGNYLTRSYQAFDDVDWKNKALSDKDLMRRAGDFIAQQNPNLTDAQVAGEVSAILQGAYENGNFMSLIAKGSLLGAKDVSSLKRRKDVPDVIKQLLGEYKDPRVNFVRSATKMQWFLANHNFLMKVRAEGTGVWLFDKPTVIKGRAYDSELASSESEPMNPLGGVYTTPDIKQGMEDALNKFDGSEFMRQLIALNSAVKYGKTIGSPTTQARNFLSASGFTILNGHFNWLYAAKSMKSTMSDLFDTSTKWRSYINHLVRIGVLHDNAYAGELRDAIKDFTDLDIYSTGWKQRPRQFLNFIQKVYRFGDDFWKIIGFENEKAIQKRHGRNDFQAEKVAAQRIRNGYPTYSMVPRAIKKIRRWPMIGSFVSFPWEILRTTKNQALFLQQDIREGNWEAASRRIVGTTLAMSGAYAASIYSMYLFGLDAEDDEAVRAQLPPWSRNSQLLYTGYNEDGSPRYLDLSYLDPYTYDKLWLSALLNNNNDTFKKKFMDAALEFLDPFIGPDIAAQAIGETIFNKKLGGGEVYNDKDPRAMVSILNHLRKATQPGIINNVERTILALEGAVSKSGAPYRKFDEGMAWIGLRFGTLDLPTSMVYKGYQFKDDKAKATRILSRTAGSQQKVDDDDLEKATLHMLDVREQAYKDMAKLVAGAKKLGMSDRQIRESLSASRVSKEDMRHLIRGTIPPWRMSKTFVKSARSRAVIRKVNEVERKEIQKEFQRRKRVIKDVITNTR